MDLTTFLDCLQEREIRYLKDYSISDSEKKYRIVIPEHFIAISSEIEDDGSTDDEYCIFAIDRLGDILARIDEERRKPKCPICGKRVSKIELHVENSNECRKRYNEYRQILLDLTKGPPRISETALTPVVYVIEEREENDT